MIPLNIIIKKECNFFLCVAFNHHFNGVLNKHYLKAIMAEISDSVHVSDVVMRLLVF